jgi:hypothetical protein
LHLRSWKAPARWTRWRSRKDSNPRFHRRRAGTCESTPRGRPSPLCQPFRRGARSGPVYGYSEAHERRRKHMRGRPGSVRSLEELGRVRLSASFFIRDFLHSEIGDFRGIPNIPDVPDLAIAAGRRLCELLLEPLQATFGRLAIRSAYRARGQRVRQPPRAQLHLEPTRLRPPHLGPSRCRRRHGGDGNRRRAMVCRPLPRRCGLARPCLMDP